MEEKDELDDILDEVDAKAAELDAEAKRLEELEEIETNHEEDEIIDDLDDILDEVESKPDDVIETVYVVETSPKSVEETVVKTSKPKRSDKHIKTKHKKSKHKRNALIALLVLIVACGGGFAVWKLKFSGQPLDAFKYVSVEFEGVDTKGTATFEVDLDAINNPDQKEIYESLTYNLSPQEGLSNGNRIKLAVEKSELTDKLLKTHKYRLDHLEKEVVVKGLYDSEQFNLFEQFTFKFEGMDGSGTAAYDTNLDVEEAYLQTIVEGTTLTFSKDKNLVNGEEITVKATFNKEAMAAMNQHKVKISEEQTTVKVEGLSDVYASMDDVKEYKELQNLALSKIKADYAKHPDTYTNFKLEYACYAADTQNNVNAVDYFNKHGYSKGSLMFIYSFDRIRGNDVAHFADNYGYTNMVLRDGSLDRDAMLLMSPYQDGATVEKVLNELQANNFKCEAQ
ncbi:hypothetical protein EPJ90_02025 [Erysipelothrix sp. strain 2 (EsS2-7-Brazil)]|uniref:hypothetical protein n=1 Tax=Erysipelothrix sp. strain 2 (EsS2-7-Brazil) TaxID=2500579 RepID=UPI001909125A|nr:hypothetical protein [Erysipelothrix sp. strain 2 (EsS2-7-Brazil)]MBK2403634.1 hypothetical protein [Erysipelothrix sp. strain 2 (EsS2-7-Brazil)]